MDTERYDIVVKVPAGTTKEQINLMWQNLLAERFGVKIHHDPKAFQVGPGDRQGRLEARELADVE